MDNPEILATLGTQDTGQSRNTGNIGHTRYRTKTTVTEGTNKNGQSRNTSNIGHTRYRTIQKYWQHWAHKIQDEDNSN
jgi:hypothetical protein